jgi:integrase
MQTPKRETPREPVVTLDRLPPLTPETRLALTVWALSRHRFRITARVRADVRDAPEGESAARTRAKNISVLKGFFEWATLSGRLHGDPARPIRSPKKRGVERTTFSEDQEQAILAQNERRDRIALHLLLKVGIRKGALQGVQFRHLDHAQKRLTIFTKGGKVQTVPVVDPAFWNELERHILDWGAQPNDYLLCRRSVRPNRHKPGEKFVREYGTSRWASTACIAGGTPASNKPVSPPAVRPRASACTRHGTRPASACSTRPGQAQGRPEAARALVHHHDRRHLVDWDIDQLAETLRTILNTEGER